MFAEEDQAHLEEFGYCVLEAVLDRENTTLAREALVGAAIESARRGNKTYMPYLDPNENNVRVFNLLDLDPLFIELIQHPVACSVAEHLLGEDFIVSNFTANIARPGSGSMQIHSDLALVMSEPWTQPGSLNIIWCLDEVTAANGGTLFMPGSHRYQRRSDVPKDIAKHMIPFEAGAGSVVVMEGRLWHTSGANTTKDQERALLFGYYSKPSVAAQWDYNLNLAEETKQRLDPLMRRRLRLD